METTKAFYKFLNEKFDTNVSGKDELKFPVVNTFKGHIIKKFKMNSIINIELIKCIIPKDDDEKSKFHFKKIYCSPGYNPNDGLYYDLVKFLNEIVE